MNVHHTPNINQSMDSMVPEFSTSKVRFVEHMAFLEIISFFGEGVGGVLYILGFLTEMFAVQVWGVLFVAAAVAALVAHLGSRAYIAWRALAKVRTSWVSRGTLFISLFMAFSVTGVLAHFIESLAIIESIASTLAVIVAPLVVIYAGMMLRSMKAVTLWRTYFLPLGFTAHSLASGLIVFLLLINLLRTQFAFYDWLIHITFFSLILAALIPLLHISAIPRSVAIEASVRKLIKSEFRQRMVIIAGGIGILLPAGCLLVISQSGDSFPQSLISVLLLLAALSRLLGDYAYRSSFVKSGAYEPIIPPASRNL